MKQAALILIAVAVLGVSALMADTTIYVTGACTVTLTNPASPTGIPTATPTVVPTATKTAPPTVVPTIVPRIVPTTPTPSATAPPTAASSLSSVFALMAARFP